MLADSKTSSFRRLLTVFRVRYWIALIRYLYFTRRYGIQTFGESSEGVSKNTISHNLKGIRGDLATERSPILHLPFSVIETLDKNSEILVVGCRTEGELLYMCGLGFERRKIKALDLISYSPWVELGDMHTMKYADDSFDGVVLGWVIAYSDNRLLAAKEILRVARNGAVIAIGVEYNPLSNEEITKDSGYTVGSQKRITSVGEILDLFGENVDQVYFSHDIVPQKRNDIGSICAIFSVAK